jgi:hypothetical protein
MQVQGTVADETTGNGIPGASVTITDANAVPTGEGVVANNSGAFSYNGSTLDTAQYMLFSSVGYKSVLAHYSVILENGSIQLEPTVSTLQDVVVTAKRVNPYAALLVAAGLLVAAYVAKDK